MSIRLSLLSICICTLTNTAFAQDNPSERQAFFGDVHIHTRNSFDAFVFGTRTTPDDAYRFAKGEKIKHDGGYEIQLAGPPLDFLAVTDHGEYLGVIPAMATPGHPLSKTETAKAAFGENAEQAQATFQQVGGSFVIGEPIEEINDQEHMNSIWSETVATADKHYKPGEFTTFAGYEFTAMRLLDQDAGAAANLHRNVIFRDKAPGQLFTTLNSINPEDLWAWMEDQRKAGIDALAIPHNSNASNGEMFALQSYDGSDLTAEYARLRMANEPIVEITQIKGTSDTHPLLSPNDEWADFEQYEQFIGSAAKSSVNEGDFVRASLARGLAIEDEIQVNPYAFGLIGSSDTHVAAATLVEETHWGKFPTDGAGPEARNSVPPKGAKTWTTSTEAGGRLLAAGQYSASGLAAVWADENTRDAIFDAMRRRETFGTSGPRMKVRFFAGTGFTPDMLNKTTMLEEAYASGVPMGGELTDDNGAMAPGFIAWATKDPMSAPLQRLQIIKVWAEGNALKEAVYDVACPGGAEVDQLTHRCPDNGASIDVKTCETSEGTAASELKAFWSDPEFDPRMDAAYYVRVLENPTCRWSTWDAIRNGTPPNPDLPATLQERAWSSPIWYKAN